MAGLGQEASVLRGERDSKRHFKSSAHREGKREREAASAICVHKGKGEEILLYAERGWSSHMLTPKVMGKFMG